MRRMKTFEVVLEDGTVVFSKLESQRYPDGEVMRCTAVVLGGKAGRSFMSTFAGDRRVATAACSEAAVWLC
jgi:hypothetical protein